MIKSGEPKSDIMNFETVMKLIIDALAKRGYDPYMQLYGYIKENNPNYITSYNNARELIQTLDIKQVEAYVMRMK